MQHWFQVPGTENPKVRMSLVSSRNTKKTSVAKKDWSRAEWQMEWKWRGARTWGFPGCLYKKFGFILECVENHGKALMSSHVLIWTGFLKDSDCCVENRLQAGRNAGRGCQVWRWTLLEIATAYTTMLKHRKLRLVGLRPHGKVDAKRTSDALVPWRLK